MQKFHLPGRLIAVGFSVAGMAACKPAATPAPATASAAESVARYDMRGVIERLGTEKDPRQLIIRHESTKGMESMAMPFTIDDAVPLSGLAVGDKISFQWEVGSHTEHVVKLEKLPAGTDLNIPGAAASATAPATGTMKGMPGM